MKDALSLEQYEEAFYIHKNLLQKTAYAILNAKNSNEKLEAFYEELHDQIDILYHPLNKVFEHIKFLQALLQ